jgi:hypothetical protein
MLIINHIKNSYIMRKCLALFIGVLLITSCEKLQNVNQQILFQIEYSNAAWGIQHNVWLIDSSGVITTYNLPAKWNTPDTDGYISLSMMNENISQSGEKKCTITKADLRREFNLIDEAKNGILTKPETRMFDGGISIYSGYIYDSKREMYQQIIIRQVGDVYIENKSSAANEIYNWLRTICQK